MLILNRRFSTACPSFINDTMYIFKFFYVKVTTLSNGVKVASVDAASPTSRIGVFLKCGSRYETLENRGISHVLRAGAFLVCILEWQSMHLICTVLTL